LDSSRSKPEGRTLPRSALEGWEPAGRILRTLWEPAIKRIQAQIQFGYNFNFFGKQLLS